MAKNDFTKLLNPERKTTIENPPPPVEWRNQRLGIRVLNEEAQQSLDNIATQLEDVTQVLDQIADVTESVLRPVIAILRTIEDPFSSFIQLIFTEIEKIIQAIEGQGLYVLDYVSPYIINNQTEQTIAQDMRDTNQGYRSKYNQWIMEARSRDPFSDLVNEKRLEELGQYVDPESGALKTDYGSPNIRELTQQELNRAADRAVDYEQALIWITRYNDEFKRITEAIKNRYDSLFGAVGATGQRKGSVIYDYYIGVDHNKTTTATREGSAVDSATGKAYFRIENLSKLVDETGSTLNEYIANILDGGNIINYTQPKSELNYISSRSFASGITPERVRKFVRNDNDNSVDEAINQISIFSDEVGKIERSGGSFTEKKRRIYQKIEELLRTNDGTAVVNEYNLSSPPRPYISPYVRNNYATIVQNLLRAPSSEVDPGKKEVLLKCFRDGTSIDEITGASVGALVPQLIDTSAGFRIDAYMALILNETAEEHRTREIQSFRKVIRYLQIEVENQGRTSTFYKPPRNKNATPLNAKPPAITLQEFSDSPTSETAIVELNHEDVQNTLRILETITSELNEVDDSESKSNLTVKKYRQLTINFIDANRRNFINLEQALVDLESAAQSETLPPANQAPGTKVIRNQIGSNTGENQVQNAFYNLMNAIISIKVSLYPLIISRKLSQRIVNQTSSQPTTGEGENEGPSDNFQIELERLITDLYASDEIYTPLNAIKTYIDELTEVISDISPEPFELYQDGFEGVTKFLRDDGEPVHSLNTRIDFLAHFSNIRDKIVSSGISLPATFYNANANGVGVPGMMLQILERVEEIKNVGTIKFDRLRKKIASELLAAEEVRRCTTKGRGVEITDDLKARIKEQSEEIQNEIDELKSIRNSLQTELSSKLREIFSLDPESSRDQINQLLDEINGTFFSDGLIDRVGGTKLTIDPFGNVQETTDVVEGNINNRLTKLNFRLNNLRIDSINRDRNIADELGDKSFKTKLATNITITEQNIAEIDARLNSVSQLDPAQQADYRNQYEERRKELRKDLDLLLSYQTSLEGQNLTATQADIVNNTINLLAETNRAIKSLDIIINDINESPLSNEAKQALLGTGVNSIDMLKHPVVKKNPFLDTFTSEEKIIEEKKKREDQGFFQGEFDYEVLDTSFSRDEYIQLFLDSPALTENVKEEIKQLQSFNPFDIIIIDAGFESQLEQMRVQVDADTVSILPYTDFRDSSTFLVNGDADLRPRFSLQYEIRKREFQKIRQRLIQQLESGSDSDSANDNNHANRVAFDRNWIEPVTLNTWTTKLIQTLREEGDPFKPIFIDDISNSKAVAEVFGKNNEQIKKNIQNATSFGEMAFVIFASISTDAEKVIKNIQNLYYMVVDPSGLRTTLARYQKQIEENFGGLFTEDLLNDIDEFFSLPDEDLLDKVKRSITNDGDPNCYQASISPNKKETKPRNWSSIRLGDLFIVGLFFDSLRELLGKARYAFQPKLGLAEVLEALLEFILQRIELLKRITAGIGLVVELIDFILSLNFSASTLTIRKVRSVNQLNTEIRRAQESFPFPFNAPTADDPMYILSVCVAMPDWFYDTFFGQIIQEVPDLSQFMPGADASQWFDANNNAPVITTDNQTGDLSQTRIADQTRDADRTLYI